MTTRRRAALLAPVPLLLVAGCTADAPAPASSARATSAAETDPAPATTTTGPPPDWTALAVAQAGCTPAAAGEEGPVAVVDTVEVGDGRTRTVTTLTCPGADGVDVVTAWDAGGEVPRPQPLTAEVRLHGVQVRVLDAAVELTGPAVAGGDEACCPGHWASLRWEWDGTRFALTRQVRVLAPADEATGEQPDVVLTDDPLPDGVQAVALRGSASGAAVLSAAGEDDDGRGGSLHVVPVAPDAVLEVLTDDLAGVRPEDPADLPALEERMGEGVPWEVDVIAGQVARLTEQPREPAP